MAKLLNLVLIGAISAISVHKTTSNHCMKSAMITQPTSLSHMSIGGDGVWIVPNPDGDMAGTIINGDLRVNITKIYNPYYEGSAPRAVGVNIDLPRQL